MILDSCRIQYQQNLILVSVLHQPHLLVLGHICQHYVHLLLTSLKEHWTTSASSPRFFFKKVEIFIPLEVYTYVMTACSIFLSTSTQLQRYMTFCFSNHFLKWLLLSWLLNLAPSHHYSSLEENSEACLCSSLESSKINWTLKFWHFRLE